ncbi:MAG: hypothetical protein AM324_011335 [Candidatus Thorarchaeota archaeon SMTZ1-83]|nr:MAG: hypothetical protein AM324_12660 [Candidatus Thorarchaeota archaeon SMTZ1-83]
MVERIGFKGPITTTEAPDDLPRRSIIKTWLMLFVFSVIVCWIAQEVVAGLGIVIPLAVVLVFHDAYIAVVLAIYPFSIMRNNKRTAMEVR